jgi:thymidylate synthase ThyX
MKIFAGITDKYDPEVKAMLGAKYSRDISSIKDRLPDTNESTQCHKDSLSKYYIGYSHKSVGQLATTDLYIENVSLLAAKAIENNPLFNGQESSTRYIDFTKQKMVSNDPLINLWQEKWREFYLMSLPIVLEDIKKQFPFESQVEGTKFNVWENTIKARVFDICRGFLPAGITTNVCFTGTFDILNDHMGEMLFHPCVEMRQIAKLAIGELSKVYPYAIVNEQVHLDRNNYLTNNHFYQDVKSETIPINATVTNTSSFISKFDLVKSLHVRSKFQKIPRWEASSTILDLKAIIDFGSYRDIHRHRPGYINMPILSLEEGFNSYYIDNINEELRQKLLCLNEEFLEAFNYSPIDKYELQYVIPIGYNVHFHYKCDINQALYLFELRSSKTVHQTLRFVIHKWVNQLSSLFGEDIFSFVDKDTDNFTLRRGTQTFNP